MNFSEYGIHVPRCQHIKTNGTQCGCPALRRKHFCYFHSRWRTTRLDLNQSGAQPAPAAIELPVLEDANSIQVTLMQVMRLILSRQLDHKTGGLLLYGLQTASSNLRHTDFNHYRKTNIVIDPQSVSENSLDDEAWSPEDFEEEEDEELAEQELLVEEEPAEEQHSEVASAAVGRDGPSSYQDTAPAAPSASNNDLGFSPSGESNAEAAQQRKNAAHGASHGSPATNDQAQKDLWTEFQSALAGAEQRNWRDLKTVFELAGIYPAKAEAYQTTEPRSVNRFSVLENVAEPPEEESGKHHGDRQGEHPGHGQASDGGPLNTGVVCGHGSGNSG